jgi:tetratricopeptide (TPR) repeat protein
MGFRAVLCFVFAILCASASEAVAQRVEWDALNQEAVGLYRAGKYARAVVVARKALEVAEQSAGTSHPAVAISLDNLALLYEAQGDYAKAEPLFKRSLALQEEALGRDHPGLTASLNHLAGNYKKRGDYANAEPLCKRSLTISEKTSGTDHPDVATSLNNLAGLYQAQRDKPKAELLYKRSLVILEKALGPDHPDVARTLAGLADLYQSHTFDEWLKQGEQVEGNDAKAEALYKRSIAISVKALGPDHLDVARTLASLADLYDAQGDQAKAVQLYERSLAISEKALGPDHPDLIPRLGKLADLYWNKGTWNGGRRSLNGDYPKAVLLRERRQAILERALGPKHPRVADGLDGLASVYELRGRLTDAEELRARAEKMRASAQ